MRILIADYYPQVRAALRLLLQYEPGMDVVGEAGEVETLLALLPLTLPETILLEEELPGRPLLEVLAALCAFDAQLRVIILGAI